MPPKYYGKKNVKKVSKPKKVIATKSLRKEIMAIKKVIRKDKPEVKYVLDTILDKVVSQSFGVATSAPLSGDFQYSLLPKISQGIAEGQRIGDSINMCNVKFRFQFINQGAVLAPIKLRMEMWKVKGMNQPASNVVKGLYEENVFYLTLQGATPVYGYSLLYDTTCFRKRNIDPKTQATKIFTKHVTMPVEQFASQVQMKNVNFTHNFKGERFLYDNTLNVPQTQYFITIFCDTGNSSTVDVDPSYRDGLNQWQHSTGIRILANIEYNYCDA